MRIETRCEHSLGLLRGSCGRATIAECVYCARPFCERHGELGPDFTNVCDRKPCQAKQKDVVAHLAWKRRVMNANRTSICAHESCEERMHHQCARCRLLFCAAHVREQMVVDPTSHPPRKEMAVICEHCRERRRLWD